MKGYVVCVYKNITNEEKLKEYNDFLKKYKNGDEIFHSYGEGYWNTRKELKKV